MEGEKPTEREAAARIAGLSITAPAGDAETDAAAAAARREQDVAMALPALGAFVLIAAPMALFAERGASFGLPAIWIYLFGAWLAMILASAAMSVWRARRAAGR